MHGGVRYYRIGALRSIRILQGGSFVYFLSIFSHGLRRLGHCRVVAWRFAIRHSLYLTGVWMTVSSVPGTCIMPFHARAC